MRLSLIAALVGGVGLVPAGALAGAGGTGSGGTGSDSGSTSTGPGAGSEGSCGSCNDPGESVVFINPVDGDVVSGDVVAAIEVRYACSCDDCGCYQDFPSSFTLSVDDSEVYACFDGCAMTHSVDLSLSPGSHQLSAAAEYSFHTESATIMVTVAGEAGSGSSGGGPGSGGSGSGGSGSSGTAGGVDEGGCRVGGSGGPGLALAWLLALGIWRRRKRAARA